jgi:quercetin dioxygenase-like cupin family protein
MAMETVPYNSQHFWHEVDPLFPTRVVIPEGTAVSIAEGDTGFGFVYSGTARTERPGFRQEIHPGMFFSVPGPASVIGLHGVLCTRTSYRGLPIWGGPIETLGRLKYIDGCSDTLLLAPPVKGDPCLNYLYIPPGVAQTAHTHPSVRVGCIIGGAGACVLADRTIDLLPGTIFVLPTDELHSFHTASQPLRVVVYHPDSDFGPTDEIHPMINRTLIANKAPFADDKLPARPVSEFIT